jgi:hypothetical protein
MELHQFAAAMSRTCACRGVPFRNRKARILSNEAEFSQDIRFERVQSEVSNAKVVNLMSREPSFVIKVAFIPELAAPSHVFRGEYHG